jgi:hypothetical protein
MDLIREFFLEAFPNPDRVGCPDEETLMALAKEGLPIDHPASLHVGSCSECFAEFTGCCLELENASAGRTGARKQESLGQLPPSVQWSEIASSVSKNREARSAPPKAVQRFLERLAAYRHR